MTRNVERVGRVHRVNIVAIIVFIYGQSNDRSTLIRKLSQVDACSCRVVQPRKTRYVKI